MGLSSRSRSRSRSEERQERDFAFGRKSNTYPNRDIRIREGPGDDYMGRYAGNNGTVKFHLPCDNFCLNFFRRRQERERISECGAPGIWANSPPSARE